MAQILIIDDEPQVRKVVRKALEKHGHSVSEAEDGALGIEAYKRLHPDLVITDILMPKKGGLAVIQEILELDERARFIAISGGGNGGRLMFLSTARTFPGVRTLKKPFATEALNELVAEILGAQGAAGDEPSC